MCLVSSTYILFLRFVHVVVCISSLSFMLLNNIPLCEYIALVYPFTCVANEVSI